VLNPTVLKIAKQLDAKYQMDYQRYLDDCESDYRNGYRPHYCEHGTNMWTDYDNICGPCEDGLSMSDGIFRMGYAIAEAKNRLAKAMAIMDFIADADRNGFNPFIDRDKAIAEFSRILTV